MRYRMKANHLVTAEAMQLPPSDADPSQELIDWLNSGDRVFSWESGRNGSIVVPLAAGGDEYIEIPPTHWVVIDANMFLYGMSPEEFADIYEAIDADK